MGNTEKMNNLTRGRPEDDTLRKEVAGRYKLRCVKLVSVGSLYDDGFKRYDQ